MMSLPLYPQVSGAENSAGAGASTTFAPAPAFHLARLFPVIHWPSFRCRRCGEFVAQVDADPYPNPPGWQHRGACV